MDLKDFGAALAKIGLPLLGAALPIPGGAAIGTALAQAIGSSSTKPEDILDTLTKNAAAMAQAKQFEIEHREHFFQAAFQYEMEQRKADSVDLQSVNATMQAEAQFSAAQNWWQKGWRPFNGYIVALGSFAAVLATCYLYYMGIVLKDPQAIGTIPSMATAIATILAVPGAAVGITAWHRGKAQIAEIQAAASKE